jgi:hypothetical protein
MWLGCYRLGMVRTDMIALFAAASLFSAGPAPGADSAPAINETPAESSPRPSVGGTVLGGLSLPSCHGQTGACESSLDAAPSWRALVLYEPSPKWGFGLAGQVGSFHWKATYLPYSVNPTLQTIESDLTVGFVGPVARYVVLPEWRVTPIIELAMGAAWQSQTGRNFNCNGGVTPTAQLAVGASARVVPAISIFAMASAMTGLPLAVCDASDGAPATPFVGWGYGLHAGAAFDVGLGSRSSGSTVPYR